MVKNQMMTMIPVSVIFLMLGSGTRKLAELPLDGITDGFLLWSDPTIYDPNLTLPVAAAFGGIFFTQIVVKLHRAGELSSLVEFKRKWAHLYKCKSYYLKLI